MRQTSKLLCCLLAIASSAWCTNLPAQDFQSSQDWQPPRFQNRPTQQPQRHQQPTYPAQIPQPEKQWWPDAQQPTQGVRAANLEVDLPNVNESVNQAKDVLANLKETANEKLSGFVGMVGDQNVGKDLKQRFANVDMKKMLGSLAVVLGGYFGFVWLVRRFNGGASGRLPSEVVDVIGVAPFGPRQNLQLVRLGTKLLLLLTGPDGTHPIGEVTDPDEVQHLTKLCSRGGRRKSADVSDAVFKNVLGRFQTEEPTTTPQRRSRSIVSSSALPSLPPAAVPQPVQDMSELERIVQRLSTVVQQNNGRSSFEA